MTSHSTGQTIHFTQAGLLHPVISYLQDRGVAYEKYLLEAGITPELIENATAPFPRNLFFRFMNAACDGEGIEDIGMLVGHKTSLQMMGEFGEVLLNVKTIHDYLKRGCQLISAASTGDYYWLKDEPEQLLFCASLSKLGEKDTVQNYLYLMLITINTIVTAIGEVWQPTNIVIPGLTPESASKLANVLPRTEIVSKGKHASFPVSNEILARPILNRSKPLKMIDDTMPSSFLTSTAQLVEILILAGQSDINSVAKAAGISSRTLQRNLQKNGTNFTDLLLQSRIRLAQQWIRKGKQSLGDIAHALGYSDAANFSRAFRRHTGQSPRAYRKDQG